MNGEIVAAAQEERFTRVKNDASFPFKTIEWLLKDFGIRPDDITAVAFYEKPLLKFERLLETYHAFAPAGIQSFLKAMPVWIGDKIFMKKRIAKNLAGLGIRQKKLFFPEHHLSHAASAFYPSPFNKAAILTIDGVGEWANTTICYGENNTIKVLKEQHFPHSLGLLYSAFTYYLGFEVNKGEYKLMGLAAYGIENSKETKNFIKNIRSEIVDEREDGSIVLNMDYFRFATHLTMTNDKKWQSLFKIDRREMTEELTQTHANLAKAIQVITEDVLLALVKTAIKLTNCDNFVMAGGVALNSVANGKIALLPEVKNLWIQPGAGDCGGSLGCCLFRMAHFLE